MKDFFTGLVTGVLLVIATGGVFFVRWYWKQGKDGK